VGVDFVALSQRTFGVDQPQTVDQFRQGRGAANANARVGPVVLSELLYHPPDAGTNDNTLDEYIELANLTAQPIPLYDPGAATNAWKLDGAVEYRFPTNFTLAANGVLLLVGFDPVADPAAASAFRTRFSVPAQVPVLGPWAGQLGNTAETLRLYRPDAPQTAPHPDAGYVPYLLVDRVSYSSAFPWPTNADGTGLSLQRIQAQAYGNEPLNWRSSTPTAGRANDAQNPDANGDGLPDAWQSAWFGSASAPEAAPGADPDTDGLTNLQEYGAGTDPTSGQSTLWLELDPVAANGRTLRFDAVAGRTYTVEYRSALFEGAWQKVADVPAAPADGPVEVVDSQAVGQTRFYRVVTPAQP
jgi:hypothetical protein